MSGPQKVSAIDNGYIVALGLGTASAMWAVGYVLRIPPALTPGWLVLILMLACLLGGGYLSGKYSGKGAISGVWIGLVCSAVNLLILGSLVGDLESGRVGSVLAIWVPASLAVGAILGYAGAFFGAAKYDAKAEPANWTVVLAVVCVAVTFLLVFAGGLVTSAEAGLAVVDWPNTEGQLMFLYPLAKMTGGIFFEHSHRLLGSLAGLATLLLALRLQFTNTRPALKKLGWCALVLVIIQGLLGGLRVTGKLTMSTDPTETAPNLYLAVVHGVAGQVFFACLIAIAVYASYAWANAQPHKTEKLVATERMLSKILVGLLVVQLVFGAILRHFVGGLHIHITLAAVVITVAIALGLRMWGNYPGVRPLEKLGLWLKITASTQLLLGIAALIATGIAQNADTPPAYMVVIATIHQSMGALLLGLAVASAIWIHRLLKPAGA